MRKTNADRYWNGKNSNAQEKEKVTVKPVRINGRRGYDVQVNHPAATVGDYLWVMNRAIGELPLDRERADGREQCRGCDLCCRERLPLTSIDVRTLMDATGITDLYNFLGRYGNVVVNGSSADITLARSDAGCILLDSGMRQCRLYLYRPLTCQTFICCPQTERAERLRELLVNEGEDELVRWWLSFGGRKRPPIVHEGAGARLENMELPPNAFSGRVSYDEVLLKEAAPAGLWKALSQEKKGPPRRR